MQAARPSCRSLLPVTRSVGHDFWSERVDGVWRSLVARPLWERKAPGSNPGTPTCAAMRCVSAGHSPGAGPSPENRAGWAGPVLRVCVARLGCAEGHDVALSPRRAPAVLP